MNFIPHLADGNFEQCKIFMLMVTENKDCHSMQILRNRNVVVH